MSEKQKSRKLFKHVVSPFFLALKDGLYNLKKGFINLFPLKTPIIKENTFIVWEPCSKSHSEVVPGFVKYFVELGYHVSVLVDKDRIKEGLFCRFDLPNVSYNKMSFDEIKRYFSESDLKDVKGVLVTTMGKICDCESPQSAYEFFNPNIDKRKLHFVEHEASFAIDKGTWDENIITLRKLNYKNAKSVAVNPHYFGSVKLNPKNETVNFITVGTLKPRKKDCGMIINAVTDLHNKGIRNFKITVVGKGKLKHLPKEIRKYFDIKGRLPFSKMYDEIEKADFMLTAYDDECFEHQRYITTGTSGNFQLIYGFLKPCILIESFAQINNFNSENSILYKKPNDYAKAMESAITMTTQKYEKMRDCLKVAVEGIYTDSLNNLRGALND